jgi:hypothetical protein
MDSISISGDGPGRCSVILSPTGNAVTIEESPFGMGVVINTSPSHRIPIVDASPDEIATDSHFG